ncbi:MAG: hypothetical protein WBM83_05255 [Flavobacteriaceae bacterium]
MTVRFIYRELIDPILRGFGSLNEVKYSLTDNTLDEVYKRVGERADRQKQHTEKIGF